MAITQAVQRVQNITSATYSRRVFRTNYVKKVATARKKSRDIIFDQIIALCKAAPSSTFDFNTSINAIIAHNKARIPISADLIKQRLSKRDAELNRIKEFFSSSTDKQCLGFVGWAPGCSTTDIKSGQGVSAVDGFLYLDKKTDKIHYQRMSSNLELFFANRPTSKEVVFEMNDEPQQPIHKDTILKAGLDYKIMKNTNPAPKSKSEERMDATIRHIWNRSVCSCCKKKEYGKKPLDKERINKLKQNFLDSSNKIEYKSFNHLFLLEEAHKNHKHYGISDKNPTHAIVIKMMLGDSEGCPCCTAGLDFDEFAAVIKELIRDMGGFSDSESGTAAVDGESANVDASDNVAGSDGDNIAASDSAVMNEDATVGTSQQDAAQNLETVSSTAHPDQDTIRAVESAAGGAENLLNQNELADMLDDAAFVSDAYQTSAADPEPIHKIADFASLEHWGVSLGVALPFSIIGLTAAFRNMKGCLHNLKKLREVIQDVDKKIWKATKDGRMGLVRNLRAFRKSLLYSKFDAKCNFAFPGVANGIASFIVFTTLFWTNPFALPFLSVYGGGQLWRNIYDYKLHKHRKIPSRAYCRFLTTVKKGHEHRRKNKISGIKKINQISRSKRRFYLTNASFFAAFTGGSSLTFASILGLAAIWPPAIFIGIGFLGLGAFVTGVLNNIYPNKFKPRNGDLGVSRLKLNPELIWEEVGKNSNMKSVLKNIRKKVIKPNGFKRFWYKFITAFPKLAKTGQKQTHKNNKALIKRRRKKLKSERPGVLQKLLKINGIDYKVTGSLTSQLRACEKLGYLSDITNVLQKNVITNKCGSHGHKHKHNHKHDHKHEHHGSHGKHCSHGKHGDHGKHSAHAKHQDHGKHCSHGKHDDHGKHQDHGKHCSHGKHGDHGKHSAHGKHQDHGKHCSHGKHGDHGKHSAHGKHQGHGKNCSHGKHGDHEKHPKKKHGGCCGSHHGGKHGFFDKLKKTGLFHVSHGRITLKTPSQMSKYQKQKVETAIDEYLYFGAIEKHQYRQYGLYDAYWYVRENDPNKGKFC